MRSFAVIAGFAAAANAYAYGAPAYNTTSTAAYEAAPTAEYPADYPAYPAESSKAEEYPAYPVSSTAAYPVASTDYPAYTTTKVVTGLTTVCPEPTTVTYGTKTYTVSSSTTIIDEDCEYTTTEVVKPTEYPHVKPSEYHPVKPTEYPVVPSGVPHPSSNATIVHPTGYPTATKPSTPEFTGAAAQAGVGLLAVIGAVAAFL